MLLVACFTSSTLSSLRARTTPRHSRLQTHVRVSMLALEELRVEELGAEASLAELARLVARLGAECPWTCAQNTTDVVRYTRAELLEVEQAASRSSQSGADEAGAEELADGQTDELTDELGDVLFNALLLIEVARRERPQLSVDTSAAAAVRKLRRRAPTSRTLAPTSS
jgi:NTP pyrophosphatase (non-canonical NTP hydrolase)